ncbi:hypothetical protein [Variovorax sp. EL159]|uniref:hypothetical protein n=1 Tax=Variovorax sp. EL159 TaxID=1566270 RepID=UPI00087EFB92|nr:hypothetical protein [Variovorax sp. EL159]SCX72648.1 hypothetical protein SAMN03159363_4372 [Variovorax sp. EL159]
MLKQLGKQIARPFWARLQPRIAGIADQRVMELRGELHRNVDQEIVTLHEQVKSLGKTIDQQAVVLDHVRRSHEELHRDHWEARHNFNLLRDSVEFHHRAVFKPQAEYQLLPADAPFLRFANCQAEDFFHPRYAQLTKLFEQKPDFHRKQWEWVYILHKFIESGIVRPGARGLVFGVGVEPLPAIFASMGAYITATDAPPDSEGNDIWTSTRQYGDSLETLFHPGITPNENFRKFVTHRPCDMNNIASDLTDYDFNWSSCCFEHLGSLEAGLNFVINAVEKTLRVGGIGVHTTELNMSSNEDTITEGPTVIYRRQDIEALVVRLRERGHYVEDVIIGPPAHALDYHVDVPPYVSDIHIKLLIASYVATSVGLVIRRGR